MVTERDEAQLPKPYEAKKNLNPYFPPVSVAVTSTVPDVVLMIVPFKTS